MQKPSESAPGSKPSREIPCPAMGDQIVFTPDVASWLKSTSLHLVCRWEQDETPFCVVESDDDIMQFVLEGPKSQQFTLATPHPGFDYSSFWQAKDEKGEPYLVCVHYPVSGKKPIPDACTPYLVPEYLHGTMLKTQVVIYDLKDRTTLDMWRKAHATPDPDTIYEMLHSVAKTMNDIIATGHNEIRISPYTVVVGSDNSIRLMGIAAFDMSWNERCAQTYHQDSIACVPPECSGYLQRRLSPKQSAYILGVLAFYLITGVNPPVCEAMDYEIALLPRAFVPGFPVGWDEIINQALHPNPELRYPSPDAFMQALAEGLEHIHKRNTSSGPYDYDIAIDTHIGVGKRLRCPVNQDAVFLKESDDKQRILLVVGDGVSTSTYGSGDIASGLLVETAQKIWDKELAGTEAIDPRAIAGHIMEQTNQAICQYIRERYADKSPTSAECMGTTALIAIVENGIMTLASIGDSRAYIIRDGFLSCITRDHNLFTIGIVNGLSVSLCANHPHAGSLVQCLGYYVDNEAEPEELSFDTYTVHLLPDDNILLTTDGILDYIDCEISVSETKIAEIVLEAPDAAHACADMIIQANLGGGGDNCGVGLIRVKPSK